MAYPEEDKKVVETKYYPVVIESEASYAKSAVSDQFYLVVHNEALDSLFAVFVQSIANTLAEGLESKLPPAAALEITKKKDNAATQANKAKVVEWLAEEIAKWLDSARAGSTTPIGNGLTKDFFEKVKAQKEKHKPLLMSGKMPKPTKGEMLVYPPKKVFDYISDSNGKKKSLGDMIKVLVDEQDLYKFLMEIGHMAG